MSCKLRSLLLITILILTSACGAKINARKKAPLAENEIDFLLIEKECASGQVQKEQVTKDIETIYQDLQKNYPMSFFFIPSRNYDYQTPLIINLEDLKKQVSDIKAKINDDVYFQGNVTAIAIDVFYLYQNAVRFEGNKCALSYLATKKVNDTRPYLLLKDFCTEKDNGPFCSKDTIDNLAGEDVSLVETSTVKMCESFSGSSVNCQAQYILQKQNKSLSTLVNMYQQKFEEERFNKLFVLRQTHLKFSCLTEQEQTIMNIKVSKNGWKEDVLRGLLESVSTGWSRADFTLNLEMTDDSGSDVVQIIPVNDPISRVPDDNNRLVYLSQQLDNNMMKKVLTHEFGHVLGFPDCYTEFFDNQSKDLIYYEISKDNTNIMCSLKSGVSVPNDYIDQLIQNSCLFN